VNQLSRWYNLPILSGGGSPVYVFRKLWTEEDVAEMTKAWERIAAKEPSHMKPSQRTVGWKQEMDKLWIDGGWDEGTEEY
jgi:hypothetical protein